MDTLPDQTMIRVRDLVAGFGSQIVLDRLDLDVRRGEILGIVGASGSGKSVLLRTIIGLNRPVAGRIVRMSVPPSFPIRAGDTVNVQERWF